MDGLPRSIHSGMKVYDNARHEIGTVEEVKFSDQDPADPDTIGAEIDATEERRPDTFIDNIAEVFAGEELPEALRERMLQQGYIRLDTKGLLASDRYILADQIAMVSDGQVILNVDKDQLLKRH